MWPVSVEGGPAGVWDEIWMPAASLPDKTLRPIFDRIWLAATTPAGRNRRFGRPVPAFDLDPGSPLLSKPLSQVFPRPP
jgi:hypothetical protein